MTESERDLDLPQILWHELKERQTRNPRYSLRAFALFLELEHSFLSKLMRRQRPINRENAKRMIHRLKLCPKVACRLLADYEIEQPNWLKPSLKEYTPIDQAQFLVIAKWHCYAILELTELSDFNESPEWIAKRLGITNKEVDVALENLFLSGLIKKTAHGLEPCTKTSSHKLGKNRTTLANQTFQQEAFSMAQEAISEIPINFRDHSTIMVATSTKKIQAAKEMIKNFRRQLCGFLSDTKDKNAVYQLTCGLYPLTKISTNGEEAIDEIS